MIAPTAKLACEVFHIFYPRLKQAQARRDRNGHRHHVVDAKHGNGNGAAALSDSVVERIVAEVGVDRIWRVIERTQPQLPLRPAE